MGYSIVKLYQNTKFYPHQNYKIDSIEDFLTKLATDYTPLVFSKCQYFKPLSLEKEIKLTCSQHDIKDFHKYNYARIEIKNDDTTTDWILYYFVMKVEWIGIGAVKLTLRMDTLNSFMDSMIFSPRTLVEREHIDRWDYNGYKKDTATNKISILRNIPYTNEGLTPQKYCGRFDDYFNIKIESHSSYSGSIGRKGDTIIEKKHSTNLLQTSWVCIIYGDTTTGDINTYIFPSHSIHDYSIYLKPTGETSATHITTFENVDTYDTKIISIYRIPYSVNDDADEVFDYNTSSNPFTENNTIKAYKVRIGNSDVYCIGFKNRESYYNKLETLINYHSSSFDNFNDIPKNLLICLNIDYSSFTSSIIDNGVFIQNNYSNESSLYSSEFLQFELFYDIFTFDIGLEDYEFDKLRGSFNDLLTKDTSSSRSIDNFVYFTITFSLAGLTDTSFGFSINWNQCWKDKSATDISSSNVMYISCNNQLPQVNSEYINYMRNGYNYDKKLIQNAREKREFDYNISQEKRAFSSLFPNPFKQASKLINIGIEAQNYSQSEYYNRLNEDLEMEKKISQLKSSKIDISSIQGGIYKNRILSLATNDNYFDSLGYILKVPMDTFWKSLSDYFYYYGNKVRQYKVPTHNNRALFDYLKCEADFINRNNVPSNECLTDIEERLKTGVTYIHKYLNQWTFDTDYKENVENGLLALL